ncbi:MAG: enoyl-CoA hydratase/isomerase family protein [Bacteroidetes bacterium]|nr:enoyl-CoA hydratase/isomerase family protein [Bacteroidota bacterium]MBS1756936.1 enoyl-CoA hydratase/isomerase family protein [Bacteroidota bacterium]
MNYHTLLVSIDKNICIITINRPEKLNALNKDVFTELDKAIEEVSTNNEIKSAIITGAGAKAFVAGADISEFASLNKEQAMALSKRGQDVFFKIENSKKPIIAAVNGFALGGGCELAMACHFRLCSTNAKFGQPEVNLGLIPGYGGTQRLTKLIGKGKSMELQMTAQLLAAEDALQLGLVNYVVEPENLLPRSVEILELINTKAPVAISKIIECVNTAVDGLKDGYDEEVKAFGHCFDTNDMKEGTSAFLEKRKAIFTGK